MLNDEQIGEQIEEVIEMLRPNLYMHGGDIEFLHYKDGIVYVSFQGACDGCPASSYTLKLLVESNLKQEVPQVKRVVDVDQDQEEDL